MLSIAIDFKNPISKPIIHRYGLINLIDVRTNEPVKHMNKVFNSQNENFKKIIRDTIGENHENIYYH
jgi:hypothetical protein